VRQTWNRRMSAVFGRASMRPLVRVANVWRGVQTSGGKATDEPVYWLSDSNPLPAHHSDSPVSFRRMVAPLLEQPLWVLAGRLATTARLPFRSTRFVSGARRRGDGVIWCSHPSGRFLSAVFSPCQTRAMLALCGRPTRFSAATKKEQTAHRQHRAHERDRARCDRRRGSGRIGMYGQRRCRH